MDNTFFDNGLLTDSFVEIQRGHIEDITRDNQNTLITVSYSDGRGRDDDRNRNHDRDRNRMDQQIHVVR